MNILFAFRTALFLTAITTFASGTFILVKGRRNSSNIAYAMVSFCVASWSFIQALASFAISKDAALPLIRYYHLPVILMPCFFLHFSYLFTNSIKKDYKGKVAFAYFICIIFFLLDLFEILIIEAQHIPRLGYAATPNLLYNICFFFYLIIVSWGFRILYSSYKSSHGLRSSQIKYIFWSTLIGFVSGGSNFLYVYHPIAVINPYATFGLPIHVLIITYAIYKYGAMDISLIVRKTVIYGALYSLLLGMFCAILILFGQWLISRSIDYRIITLSILAMLIVVASVKPLDRFLTKLTDKFLFREKYEYHQALKEASAELVKIRELNKLLEFIVNTITRQLKVKRTMFILSDKISGFFELRAEKGKVEVADMFIKLTKEDPLIQYLKYSEKPLIWEELKLIASQSKDELLMKSIDEMENLNIRLSLPIFQQGKLIGVLFLGEKLSGEMYSQEDLSLLTTLALQAGLAIENAEAYEELAATKDKLFEAEKFATIGRLAGGIAHEIKNPLAAIKTFTEYLNQKYDDKDFREKFQRIVGSEVDRINYIVEQLVTYAHPKQPHAVNVDLHKIIEETLALIEDEAKKDAALVEKQFAAMPIYLIADSKQLKQVFLNLLLNGLQAMKHNGSKPRTLTIITEKVDSQVIIKISDSGEGIPTGQIPKIFDPFFTTKDSGSGLGLSIVKSIVESHKGAISVQSEVDKGTTFLLSFPI